MSECDDLWLHRQAEPATVMGVRAGGAVLSTILGTVATGLFFAFEGFNSGMGCWAYNERGVYSPLMFNSSADVLCS